MRCWRTSQRGRVSHLDAVKFPSWISVRRDVPRDLFFHACVCEYAHTHLERLRRPKQMIGAILLSIRFSMMSRTVFAMLERKPHYLLVAFLVVLVALNVWRLEEWGVQAFTCICRSDHANNAFRFRLRPTRRRLLYPA